MKIRPLTTNERAETPGYTHVAVITADDLTQATANTAQTITLFALKVGDIVKRIGWYLRVPFQNTADAAFNSDTVSVGDTAAVTTHLAAAEANLNGTEIIWRTGVVNVLYTAADILTVTFNSMAAKSLLNLNRGELILFISLERMKDVADAMASTQISKT
jgi:hypothetical protein